MKYIVSSDSFSWRNSA